MKYSMQDKIFKWTILSLKVVLVVFFLLLFGFLVKRGNPSRESNIPSLDKGRLEKIVKLENSRQDVDTQGRPDITKFNYGNEEPFR